MKREWSIFLTAVMFYTRIPCPKWVDHSADMLNKATKYFPLIGWVVGGFACLVYFGAAHFVPTSIAVVLSMIASILLTGAFHEDGFADVCDGFGGGWTKEKILKIMKDSAIGAYGALGMLLIIIFKFLLLWELSRTLTLIENAMVLFAAHSISRANAVYMIFTDEYARDNEDAKAKPVAKQMKTSSFVMALIIGLAPMIYFQNLYFLSVIPVLILVKLYLSRYFKKWIGGYTGDCLGTVQQTSEIAIYLTILILWKYI
ncbi:adenosylcobinamide-GDP ribazoletransferase [Reichenbachiella carrageenanivorans]|uniref:Adenosylcobinamide-GDP ribazoletransferase n=1 Tax=Reichenbachiella carrageenanivorans TaxID=2979869 RepID=A0ABY6CVY8_9BACT|nr:adenosylcobinamide-GDP ribazoletransferase [Reichenbachiella carrageenanivorans]UXX78082.1 adenosylcobinamide-GDP ribazoletransferase [Reichenbachiella carrageenanivorans]